MPKLSLVPVIARELFGAHSFLREAEPDLVMDDPEQVAAYSYIGRVDGDMSAVYIYHSARISQVIQGCSRVIDLGCGPATQLAQVAELNPTISFLGVDLSDTMIDDGRTHVANLGLQNVEFQREDITRLDGVADASVDAVMSTVALHHLPTRQHLNDCFQQIARVLKPGGRVYLTDFGRLKSLKSIAYFTHMNAEGKPPLFLLDYERSLRAAFTLGDFEDVVNRFLPGSATVFSTVLVPFFVFVRSDLRPLPPPLSARVKAMRLNLSPKFRKELDELRLFSRFGGIGADPFK